MKKIVGPLLAIFLVLAIASMAQAGWCTAESRPCVDVEIGVFPDSVCPGQEITVMGKIENCGDCRDLFKVWIKLGISGAMDLNFPGKVNCICPKIILPLAPGAELKFIYDTRILRIVPPGEYTIGIYAESIRSGTYDEASTSFTVKPPEDCITTTP